MNVIIVEDELLATERLKLLLAKYDSSIQVSAALESIEETVKWLKTQPHPDLLLMDIELSDGHSFEIFRQVRIDRPVIFTTAYDNYAINAFQHFSIDYIMKPVTSEALATGIHKYKLMSNAFYPPNYHGWAEQLKENFLPHYKDRFLAKVGQRSFFIQTDEVAYFYADNKTTYLVDRKANKFVINFSIEKLESLLDPYYFFRVNRKIIVHSKMIDLGKPYMNSRLKLSLKNFSHEEEIIVSRERVAAFRKWAEG
ncbi:MAG: LytTR family DNA-binding domain-containing protein [Ferruginibacter sp.]